MNWLGARTTAMTRENFPGFTRLPTATANWLCGFMMGLPDETHLLAIDAILNQKPMFETKEAEAIREVKSYLLLHGVVDFEGDGSR